MLHVTEEAGVQFKLCPMFFRVIRIHDWPTYDHLMWLDGYQLGRFGEAVERRSILVIWKGLHWIGDYKRTTRLLPLAVAGR